MATVLTFFNFSLEFSGISLEGALNNMKLPFILALVAAAALTIVGCGGSTGGGLNATTSPPISNVTLQPWSVTESLKPGSPLWSSGVISSAGTWEKRTFRSGNTQVGADGSRLLSLTTSPGVKAGPGDSGTPIYVGNVTGGTATLVGVINSGYDSASLYAISPEDMLSVHADYMASQGRGTSSRASGLRKEIPLYVTGASAGTLEALNRDGRRVQTVGAAKLIPGASREASGGSSADTASFTPGGRYVFHLVRIDEGRGGSLYGNATVSFKKDEVWLATGHPLFFLGGACDIAVSRGVVDFQLEDGSIVASPATGRPYKLVWDGKFGSIIAPGSPDLIQLTSTYGITGDLSRMGASDSGWGLRYFVFEAATRAGLSLNDPLVQPMQLRLTMKDGSDQIVTSMVPDKLGSHLLDLALQLAFGDPTWVRQATSITLEPASNP